ncbi:phage tail tip lysozyme [Streptococcus sp. 19428wC2_LYSM12]|uniref:phage tail tip lysozyme n=2 Tax=Streptococcus TaxID=1301 RepID=UPI0026317C1C|nr:phage tail tip lysozyme [Streptococcus sp. 19428wC2_LYSM12]
MDEKKALQLQRDQAHLKSSSSGRKRLSMSQRNWKKMGTRSKASFLKRVSPKDLERVREGVRKTSSKQISLSQKKRPARTNPRENGDIRKEASRGGRAGGKPLSSKRKGAFRLRLGRGLKREVRQKAAALQYQEEGQELSSLQQGVQLGKLGLYQLRPRLGTVSSRLSTHGKSQSLSLSSGEDRPRKKKLPLRKRFSSSKDSKSSIWGLGARSVPVLFSTSILNWSAWVLGGFGLFLLLITSVFGQMFPIQSEYDLNETYLYMTQLDRKKSTDEVVYYTNWEDPLLYLHYRYEAIHADPRLDATYHFMDQQAGRRYVEDLWQALNSDPNDIKTMQDLYRNDQTKYGLTKEEQASFEELMETSKELGKFALLLELDNPFYLEEDPRVHDPLNIKERFGYRSEDKRTDTTLLAMEGNHPLYAPLTGKAVVADGVVTIETLDAKFSFYHVSGIRVTDGQEVAVGTQIGQTSPAGDQTVSYQKKLTYTPKSTLTNWHPEPREDWFYVNPGFYFKSVRYLEETYVKASHVDADKAEKVQLIKNYLTKELQKEGKQLSLKGLASILGNFDSESSINPKRAEGDYLSPPIGASSSSWDDPNWLSMNGPAIYNGRYPNILRRGLGLGQWTDTADGSVRHTLLVDYARKKDKKWYDLELQLDFLLHGDTAYHQAVVREILTSEASTDDLTLAFLVKWEGNPGSKLEARRQSAKQWEAYLKGGIRLTGSSSQTIPAGYKDKLPYGLPSDQALLEGQGYPGNAYVLGNCTWYVYNRFYQIGSPIDPYLGNATNWVTSAQLRGYRVTSEPRAGAAAVFLAGVAGSDPMYGHVGFCEVVNEDGTFLMSEMNATGSIYGFSWRVVTPQTGIYFITPNEGKESR